MSRPSGRVAAAERKLRIVNDSQAKSFDPKNVECALCEVNVNLQGEGDYNLTSWEAHKRLWFVSIRSIVSLS